MMKSVLQGFLEQSIGKKDQSVPISAEKDGQKNDSTDNNKTEGHLLLSGCNDWQNATAKNPQGLPSIHRVALPKKTSGIYSSSSSMHCFIILEDCSVYAMGRNENGQLGIGDTKTREYPERIQLPFKCAVRKIATGRSHSMMLLENGELWGCGSSAFGQLGQGSSTKGLKDILSLQRIKLPEDVSVRDIACGNDFSLFCNVDGVCYSFGHPEYGQLGHGSTGEYIKEGGKGAALQYACVYEPRRIETFVVKDSHGKVTSSIPCSSIRMRKVFAGRNHSVCIEDWDACSKDNLNRVFSWGFGGYGRLGHNSSQDEYVPREITTFSHFIMDSEKGRVQVQPVSTQKQIRDISCGSSFTIGVSSSGCLYFWGKMSNSARGEATMYPQQIPELIDYSVLSFSTGSNLIVVSGQLRTKPSTGHSNPVRTIAWGAPISGKIGFEGDAKTSTSPKFLSALEGISVSQISCGYGHILMVASESSLDNVHNFPAIPNPIVEMNSKSKKRTSDGQSNDNKGKKPKK